MNHFAIRKAAPHIRFQKCPATDLDLVNPERGRAIQEQINAMLAGESKGWLVDKIADYLTDIETTTPEDQPFYTLIPLNFVFWLYNMGLSQAESGNLYNKLAQGYRKLVKTGAHRGPDRIAPNDIPVSPTMLKLLRTPDAFNTSSLRTFMNLQGLFTGLACVVRDWKGESEESKLCGILEETAPRIHKGLYPINMGGCMRKPLSAVYTSTSPACNVYLFRTCRMGEAVMLLLYLVAKARQALNMRGSIRSRVFTREEFFAKIFAFMELSKHFEPSRTERYKVLGGQNILW